MLLVALVLCCVACCVLRVALVVAFCFRARFDRFPRFDFGVSRNSDDVMLCLTPAPTISPTTHSNKNGNYSD